MWVFIFKELERISHPTSTDTVRKSFTANGNTSGYNGTQITEYIATKAWESYTIELRSVRSIFHSYHFQHSIYRSVQKAPAKVLWSSCFQRWIRVICYSFDEAAFYQREEKRLSNDKWMYLFWVVFLVQVLQRSQPKFTHRKWCF